MEQLAAGPPSTALILGFALARLENLGYGRARPVRDDEVTILRCRHPYVSSVRGRLVVQTLIGQKEEEFVFLDRAANAGRVLAVIVLNANGRSIIRAAPLVIGVEIRVLINENAAAMKLVRSRFGSGLDVGAAAASVGRIVIGSLSRYVLDRLRVRRDHRRTAPTQTVHVYSVDVINVLLNALSG